MKSWTILIAISSAFLVESFPTTTTPNLRSLTPKSLNHALEAVKSYRKEKRFIVDPSKPIGISGKHAFQAPSKDDQRGPCPGLNALANHGYIPHDGITSYGEVVTAINQVFGMGIDLALILGLMGTVWTGNPLSLDPGFSIGGTVANDGSDNLLGNLVGVIGDPRGLQGSHNWIESDSSLTRDDLYVTGDAWTMNMTLFRDIYGRADENGVISMDLLAEQAARRWQYSVSHNPNFYYGPVTGMISRNAGYMFLGRLLSNHTEEYPDGVLSQEVLKSFFAVYEDAQGNLEYRQGHETFPENWFRRSSEYGLIPLNVDIISWVMKHPELGSIGGNTGNVNSFSGLDLRNMTGGLVTSASLLEGNNLLCFAFELLKTFLPNSLSPLLATLAGPINMVTDVLATSTISLACPAWQDLIKGGEPLWDVIQHKFPGASKSGSSL
ncbi:Cloroperoxidase [Didymella exigua CBS 183.55]|uniref:Cloroperoxidase n=1 Tax=Didymella exigua CBS 183.55 TaxID=1150837 RepID=A0A6A5RZ25_9PLEO|nr:Cloroperoxidase [Didymella exigua CBS 183.55]KAF1933715.1 Cloroperoxidase [Didymella exigua CBS 183.55]